MELVFELVKGKNIGDIKLYALSTCAWCEKTKDLLKGLGIEFKFIYVDLLQGDTKQYAIDEVRKYNKNCSFPTLVINNDKTIVGFKATEIKEALS
ncbi:MAG: Glutaredoxin [Candidatus Methanofastidiosum methylothiophilum]|jgi:glutaredoxin|uniref:Glutaredoxin n=1 Tax=Candidatus Methanofastidiosum methylothiophilum TaxID=1705564 RepID=A0A150JN13_9EURY|nr:MAG: Glutaredoxin [Candidatus Methanofastidiosum methylthiophilus]MBP6933206.1 glutaredoxin family protein [Methanofastidiosum sp.]OQC51608.1 MAG: Glutaredoxin [Euryarchaeota archaeon ADurb.Bin023]KYC57438.1 MAG: Glutaredoxin [Candidatus Methanofastidiosum methylthiophilus]KYC58224.1 MAG: Glutaredoxin [Candidatus Methanofastidiosum methylthiophilus]